MRSLQPRSTETRGPRSHHRTTPADFFHFRCCLWTQGGSGRVCGISHCSASLRRCSTSYLGAKKHLTIEEKSQICVPKESCAAPSLDCGRPTTPCSHTNFEECSRHRVMPRWETNVSNSFLQHRWKHEIQTAFFRRRAAMARAVVPNTSAREHWLPGRTHRLSHQPLGRR